MGSQRDLPRMRTNRFGSLRRESSAGRSPNTSRAFSAEASAARSSSSRVDRCLSSSLNQILYRGSGRVQDPGPFLLEEEQFPVQFLLRSRLDSSPEETG